MHQSAQPSVPPHAYIRGQWPNVCMAFNGGSAGSLQQSSFRENPTRPSLPTEYVTVHTHTDRPNYSNPPTHARRGLMSIYYESHDCFLQ